MWYFACRYFHLVHSTQLHEDRVRAVLAAAIAVPDDRAASTFEASWKQVELNTRTKVQLYADQIASAKLATSALDEL